MKAREAHHKTILTEGKKVEESDKHVVTPGEKQNGNASKQDLQRALQESRDSEARLRKILDTIPALAWCNLSDGSNDFVNQRWSDYTGLSQEEVKRVGCKVAIHPEDLPKWLDQWRSPFIPLVPGGNEAGLPPPHGASRRFPIPVEPLQGKSRGILPWLWTKKQIQGENTAEGK